MTIPNTKSPLIPETHGTVAIYAKGFLSPPDYRMDVIAWDTEGYALVIDADGGRLVRAVDVPDFALIHVPEADVPTEGDAAS